MRARRADTEGAARSAPLAGGRARSRAARAPRRRAPRPGARACCFPGERVLEATLLPAGRPLAAGGPRRALPGAARLGCEGRAPARRPGQRAPPRRSPRAPRARARALSRAPGPSACSPQRSFVLRARHHRRERRTPARRRSSPSPGASARRSSASSTGVLPEASRLALRGRRPGAHRGARLDAAAGVVPAPRDALSGGLAALPRAPERRAALRGLAAARGDRPAPAARRRSSRAPSSASPSARRSRRRSSSAWRAPRRRGA